MFRGAHREKAHRESVWAKTLLGRARGLPSEDLSYWGNTLSKCASRTFHLEMGAIIVRFMVSAARLLLMAVVLNSSNFASSSALRKALPREATC
jgi:hypothetical protein